MKEELCNKLNSLPSKDRTYFYKRLINIFNDRRSCFVYGDITDKEYAALPKKKIEKIEETLYYEIFGQDIGQFLFYINFAHSLN